MAEATAEATRRRNRSLFGSPFAAVYTFYMEHEAVSRRVARAVWGGDIRPFYASMEEIGRVPDGGTVADVPCGAGAAFRGLRREQEVNYLAVDLSEAMLERARTLAAERGLDQITFLEGDAEALPLEDGSLDLFLSYWGLHCFADPVRAIDEAHRCLKPGGRLVGAAIVSGESLRQRLIVRPNHSAFGEVFDAAQLKHWLEDRYEGVRIDVSGALAQFAASKGKRPEPVDST
jgi:SAM-dependent methyltransferase